MFSFLGFYETSDIATNVARIVFALGILAGVAVGFTSWLVWNYDALDDANGRDLDDMSLLQRLAPTGKLLGLIALLGAFGGLVGALLGSFVAAYGFWSSAILLGLLAIPVTIMYQAYKNEARQNS